MPTTEKAVPVPIPGTIERRRDGSPRRLVPTERVGVVVDGPRPARYRLDSVGVLPGGGWSAMFVKQRKAMSGGGDFTRGGRIVLNRAAIERDHPALAARLVATLEPAPPVGEPPAEPQTETLSVPDALVIHEGSGPMYLREVLATATERGVEFEVTRIIPMGLHIRATSPVSGRTVVAVVDEQAVIRALCGMLVDRLEPPFPGGEG